MLTKRAGAVAAGLAGVAMVAGFGFPGHAAVRPGGQRSPAVRVVDPVLNAVWCSGPRRCLGVGTASVSPSISAVWNGRSWRFVKTPDRGVELTALGCSGWTECMAIGGSFSSGVIDEWNGVSWKSLPTIKSASLDSVACAARHRCVAVGGGDAFAWNGKVWSRVPLPPRLRGGQFPHVACAGPADCMAVGTGAMRWNGVKWHQVAASVTCLLEYECSVSGDGPGRYVAVGDSDKSFFWNGHSWREVALPVFDELPGISCTGSFCLAVGSSSDVAWNGRKWSALPSTGFGNAAVWCTRRTACMDVGSGLASFWNGRRWTPQRLSTIDRLAAVSCTRPGNCIAVGLTNNLALAPLLAPDWLAERWNGSKWQVIPGPARTGGTGQEQISCTSTRFCMAVNTLAYDPGAQRWNGRKWIATNLPADVGEQGVEGLSCSSASNCLAIAGDAAWAWDGTSWHATASPGISGQYVDLQSVSCASATMCMAIGYDFTLSTCGNGCTVNLLAEQWNGSSWSVSNTPVLDVGSVPDFLPSNQISCPSATFCMQETTASALPGGAGVMSWNGQTWTQQKVSVASFYAPPNISCGGTSSCVVVRNTEARRGAAEVWNGTSWRATRLAPGGLVNAVSCSRPGRCVAVGTTAGDLTMAQSWDGTAWKLLHPVNP
jgi:hypothetical protein